MSLGRPVSSIENSTFKNRTRGGLRAQHRRATITSQLVIQMPRCKWNNIYGIMETKCRTSPEGTASHDFSDLSLSYRFNYPNCYRILSISSMIQFFHWDPFSTLSVFFLQLLYAIASLHQTICFMVGSGRIECKRNTHRMNKSNTCHCIATYRADGNKTYISNKYIRNVKTYLFKILVTLVACSIVDPHPFPSKETTQCGGSCTCFRSGSNWPSKISLRPCFSLDHIQVTTAFALEWDIRCGWGFMGTGRGMVFVACFFMNL